MNNHTNIFQFLTFHTKLWFVQNHCVLGSINQMGFWWNIYLVLFGVEKYHFIYNRIRYLIGVKSDIVCVFLPNYAKIKVHSYDPLPFGKILTFHNITIHIKVTTTIIYLEKNQLSNYLKIVIINSFWYKL